MSTPTPASHMESARRDTISLRTIFRYDPMQPRATTPVVIGGYVVTRRPLQDSIHILYTIMDGSDAVATSISIPDALDCETAITKHRLKQATRLADQTIARAKRKPRAVRVMEAA
jgi:hypothetical protein